MNRFILLLIVAFFISCSTKSSTESEPTVTVSIVPQKFIINQIASDWVQVNVMIPLGSSPATYDPSPRQLKSLSNSSHYFRIGHIGFEKAWMSKLSSVNPKMKVIDTSKDLELIQEEEFGTMHSDDHGHSHVHEGFNPHTWLSPKLVKDQAKIIYKELAKILPNKVDVMQANLDAFISKVDSTSLVLDAQLNSKAETNFIVYHPVWTYLANDYNLNQVSIEFNGKEASAKKLKEIIDYAKANNIRIVFAQKEFNAAQAKSIANEINGEVVLLNPLDYNWFKIMEEFGEAFQKL